MIKINMGCGCRDFGNDWIHIDGGNYPHLDYDDISKLQQFGDNSVDLIYSSHVIEYFDREEILDVLGEWNRILKKGGILRIAVPDFRSMANLYINGQYPLEKFLGPLYGKMKMSNQIIYHKTTYDFESLEKVLRLSGFLEIGKYNWEDTDHSVHDDHSQAYLPHMDKQNGTLISLNVECRK